MTILEQTNVEMIPLSALAIDPLNVRKHYHDADIAEFANSLAAEGVLQNLNVRAEGESYLVSAGGRRFRALKLLEEQGVINADFPVPCCIRDEERAVAISLAENFSRERMHPADEFRAFLQLAEAGESMEAIAEKFGTNVLAVKKRLKLARVSPTIIAMYEEGELQLGEVEAFALVDDVELQEEVLAEFRRDGFTISPHRIRARLGNKHIRGTDRRVRFVGGLDVVAAAGGTVVRDLFSQNDDDSYLMRSDWRLLGEMVDEKVRDILTEQTNEGFKWAEFVIEFDYATYAEYGRVYPIQQAWNYDGPDEYAEGEKERAGVVVSLDYSGEIRLHKGLVKPEDMPAEDKAEEAEGEETEPAKPLHSKALMADLTARRTAILARELAKRPSLALAATVHALGVPFFYNYRCDPALSLSMTVPNLTASIADHAACDAWADLDATRTVWKEQLPDTPAEFWDWCLAQDDATLLNLQAFLVANSLDTTDYGNGFKGNAPLAMRMHDAIGLDMTDHYKPDVPTYYKRMTVEALQTVVAEAVDEQAAAPMAGMKKKDAVEYAAKRIEGTGWLPAPMTCGNPELA